MSEDKSALERWPSRRRALGALIALSVCVVRPGSALAQAADPLPSWNDGAAKTAITDFVGRHQRGRNGLRSVRPEREYVYDRQSKIGKLDNLNCAIQLRKNSDLVHSQATHSMALLTTACTLRTGHLPDVRTWGEPGNGMAK